VHELWFVKLKGSRTGKYSPLHYCRRCNLFFQRPNYREDDKTLQGDLQWHLNKIVLQKGHVKKILLEAKKVFSEAKTVLDIGCGVGVSILVARELGLSAQGVEINPYAVRYARDNFSIDLVQAYFAADLFRKKFDIVMVDNVLEHLPDLRSFVKDVFAVLKPEGVLYLAVPGRKGGLLRIIYSFLFPTAERSLFLDNDVHINHFSRRTILNLIEPYNATIHLELHSGAYIIQLARKGFSQILLCG